MWSRTPSFNDGIGVASRSTKSQVYPLETVAGVAGFEHWTRRTTTASLISQHHQRTTIGFMVLEGSLELSGLHKLLWVIRCSDSIASRSDQCRAWPHVQKVLCSSSWSWSAIDFGVATPDLPPSNAETSPVGVFVHLPVE